MLQTPPTKRIRLTAPLYRQQLTQTGDITRGITTNLNHVKILIRSGKPYQVEHPKLKMTN